MFSAEYLSHSYSTGELHEHFFNLWEMGVVGWIGRLYPSSSHFKLIWDLINVGAKEKIKE